MCGVVCVLYIHVDMYHCISYAYTCMRTGTSTYILYCALILCVQYMLYCALILCVQYMQAVALHTFVSLFDDFLCIDKH